MFTQSFSDDTEELEEGWQRSWPSASMLLKGPPGTGIMELINQVLPGGGEDARPLQLTTSSSGRTQTVVWNGVNLLKYKPLMLREGQFFEKNWTKCALTALCLGWLLLLKRGPDFCLLRPRQPTTEMPAQVAQLTPGLSHHATSAPSSPSSWALFQLPWKCGLCPLSPWDASVLSKLTY